jgi:hypothetical protein
MNLTVKSMYRFRVKAHCLGETADFLHSPWSNQSLWNYGTLSGVTMPVPAGPPTLVTAAQRTGQADGDVTLSLEWTAGSQNECLNFIRWKVEKKELQEWTEADGCNEITTRANQASCIVTGLVCATVTPSA